MQALTGMKLRLWKDDEIRLWTTDDVCADIEARSSMDSLDVVSDSDKFVWYNKFLAFVLSQDELLLKKYALLPNMNGTFLKKDKEGFKQGEGVTSIVLDVLAKLDGDMKPLLLHESITTISLDSKFNSTSYSAKVNSLAKGIIDTPAYTDATKLAKLQPLISIVVSDSNKYEQVFVTKRSRIFTITKESSRIRNIPSASQFTFVIVTFLMCGQPTQSNSSASKTLCVFSSLHPGNRKSKLKKAIIILSFFISSLF